MDNLMLGLKVAAIGIVAVFVVLFILMLAIKCFEKVVAVMKNAKKKTQTAPAVATAPSAVTAVVAEDESEIVAVISAAIMAILASENGGNVPSFQIKKIKQIKRN
ncbi:MAG: OadG family protein [Bacillota bacterium]